MSNSFSSVCLSLLSLFIKDRRGDRVVNPKCLYYMYIYVVYQKNLLKLQPFEYE